MPQHARGDEEEAFGAKKDLQEGYKVYVARWWLLFLYSSISALQCTQWNLYSPIAGVVRGVFGWSNDGVEGLSNAAGVTYTLTVVLAAKLLDQFGARFIVCGTVLMLVAASILRLLPVPMTEHYTMVFVSMILNGIAASASGLLPAVLSSVWFPPKERTVATAIGSTANYFGMAFSFAWGPAVVPANKTNHGPPPDSLRKVHEALLATVLALSLHRDRCYAVLSLETPFRTIENSIDRKGEICSINIPNDENKDLLVVAWSFGLPLGWYTGCL